MTNVPRNNERLLPVLQQRWVFINVILKIPILIISICSLVRWKHYYLDMEEQFRVYKAFILQFTTVVFVFMRLENCCIFNIYQPPCFSFSLIQQTAGSTTQDDKYDKLPLATDIAANEVAYLLLWYKCMFFIPLFLTVQFFLNKKEAEQVN